MLPSFTLAPEALIAAATCAWALDCMYWSETTSKTKYSPTSRTAIPIAVPAGTYRAVLIVDGKEFVQPVTVENDPHADPKAIITVEGQLFPDKEDDEE